MRRFFLTTLVVSGLFAFLPVKAQNFSGVEIRAQEIAGGYYVLYGAGGNIGMYTGDDGIILIDDQFAPLNEAINTAIDNISNDDIKFIINTHWHGDHTGGNENFAAQGAIIVAHEFVRRRMSMEVFLPLYNSRTTPSPIEALPVVTFTENITFHSGNEAIKVYHVPNAHTDTDSFVYFENANVIHLSDLYWTSGYPRIDVQNGGGSVDGVINAIEMALELGNENTQFIPGHGNVPLSGKAAVRNYLMMLKTVKTRVANMIEQGMSEQQIIMARPTEDFDSDFIDENSYIDGNMFTRIVYLSLTNNNFIN